jgi:hypothetical protein
MSRPCSPTNILCSIKPKTGLGTWVDGGASNCVGFLLIEDFVTNTWEFSAFRQLKSKWSLTLRLHVERDGGHLHIKSRFRGMKHCRGLKSLEDRTYCHEPAEDSRRRSYLRAFRPKSSENCRRLSLPTLYSSQLLCSIGHTYSH